MEDYINLNNPVVSISYKGDIIGTGFLTSPTKILTCQHVTLSYKNIKAIIYYSNKQVQINIKKIYSNRKLDFSLFELPESFPEYLEFGRSKLVKLEDPLTIECPHYRKHTRKLRRIKNVGMYTDDDIYNYCMLGEGDRVTPGTSGSPVFNKSNEVIGVIVGSGQNKKEIYSFFMPSDTIQEHLLNKLSSKFKITWK